MQIEVITAKFNGGIHSYTFSPNGLTLKQGDNVIVDTEKGKDIVKVTKENYFAEEESLELPLKNVIKVASEEEKELARVNQKKVQGYLPKIKELVKQEKLDMTIVAVECNYNLSRLTIHFMAEERVDFRELVKKLAETYKTRIELHQIGPRDRARLVGGLGICGKECCCKQGLGFDERINIKMAKNQGLSLNPVGISGVCGKLLCCLAYENPYYVQVMKELPRVGMIVKTPDGEGRVMYNDLIKKRVSVKFQTQNTSEIKTYESDEIVFDKSKNENFD